MSDDFDDDFDIDDFDDLNSDGTLADLWKNNAFVKVGVILAALAFIIALIVIFGGKKEKDLNSRIKSPEKVSEAPGTSDASKAYTEAIEDVNRENAENAVREKTSNVPIPIGSPKGRPQLDNTRAEEEDPLDRWRRMQEERLKTIKAQKKEEPVSTEPVEDTRGPAVAALAEAMAAQMESILDNVSEIDGPDYKEVAQMKYLEDEVEQERERVRKERKRLEEERKERAAAAGESDDEEIILLPAATIEYAQLLTEANTDVPGPILAEIASGPLKGARLLGEFEETYDYLTLNFDQVVFEGVSYETEAVAIDPATTLPGLITDIDRRYFKRVILPTASAFITGFADAVASSGQTTIRVQGDTTITETDNERSDDEEVASGIAEAGQALGGIIDEIAENTKARLRVKSGTPLGILFIESVTTGDNEEDTSTILNVDSLKTDEKE